MLCNDIVVDVMDELRRERKILMVLEDRNVDKYVSVEMSEVDLADPNCMDELDGDLKQFVDEKLEFREEFSLRTSTTRLDYIYRMLKDIFGSKATIEDPERYIGKVKKIERQEKKMQERLERQGSSASMFSLFSKSQMTSNMGTSLDSQSNASGGHEAGSESAAGHMADNIDGLTTSSQALSRNPVLKELQEFIETIDG